MRDWTSKKVLRATSGTTLPLTKGSVPLVASDGMGRTFGFLADHVAAREILCPQRGVWFEVHLYRPRHPYGSGD